MRAEILRQAQKRGLLLHVLVVCAAGEVQGDAAAAQHGKKLLRAGHKPVRRGAGAAGKAGAPPVHRMQQPAHVFVLVFLRAFLRCRPGR